VTGLKLYSLPAAIGKIVAILALLPPWVLLFLVSGRRGIRTGWPLAVVGSLAYIAGQFPISQFAGPYLPDIVGSLTSCAPFSLLLPNSGIYILLAVRAPRKGPNLTGRASCPRPSNKRESTVETRRGNGKGNRDERGDARRRDAGAGPSRRGHAGRV
jgi:hypothetical protein